MAKQLSSGLKKTLTDAYKALVDQHDKLDGIEVDHAEPKPDQPDVEDGSDAVRGGIDNAKRSIVKAQEALSELL